MSSRHISLPTASTVLGQSACSNYSDHLKELTSPHDISVLQRASFLRKLCKDEIAANTQIQPANSHTS